MLGRRAIFQLFLYQPTRKEFHKQLTAPMNAFFTDRACPSGVCSIRVGLDFNNTISHARFGADKLITVLFFVSALRRLNSAQETKCFANPDYSSVVIAATSQSAR